MVLRQGGGTNQQSRFAVIVSLAVHMLLLLVLYQQRLAYLADSTRPQELVADSSPQQEAPDAEYRLELDADSPDRTVSQESLAIDQPTPARSELRRHEEAPAPSTPTFSQFNRRDLAGASLVDAATIAAPPPIDATESAGRAASVSAPELPAMRLTQDDSRQRTVDPLLTIAQDSSRARSRRQVEAALLPEISSEAERPTAETTTYATSSIDALATSLDRSPDPATSRMARTAADNLARTLISTGGIDRPRRSRDPIPAAPIVAQLPGPVRRPAPAYADRGRRRHPLADAGRGRPSAETDAAIELGLQFLARTQLDDGHWEFQYLGESADLQETERIIIRADAAATGLALLAFLGAGHDHFGSRYEHNVQAGLDYLKRIQSSSGELFPEHELPTGQMARFYGHGIATLALCEAYGVTGDPELRQPAQAAIDFLVATQHPQFGGWRYVPGMNTDLSVSGWQLVALKSGELAGLSVRGDTYARLRTLVEQCREPDGKRARFCYNPWASPTDPLTRHGRQPSTVMTSVGMLMQLHLAADPSDERLRMGADHLLANLPQLGDAAAAAPTGTLGNPQRDTYYWYYATQVMYRLGGEYWQQWTNRLHPLLETSQTTGGPLAGSWDPHRPVPDKWANYGGRLFVTAMNLLSLEIYDRHLPLDESTPSRIADRPKD
jgi:hypothetical protein